MTPARTRPADPLTFAAAEELLFPTAVEPVSADTVALFAFHIGRFVLAGYGDALAALHARSLATHPELAWCCRQASSLEDAGNAAAQFAPRLAQDPAVAADAAVAKFKRTIAEQLAAADGHELQHAARVVLAGLDAAVREEAERAAAAEREQAAAAEQAAAEQAAKRAEAERLRADTAAAEEASRSADAIAAAVRENYRASRARRLVAELEVSGIATLRIPGGRMRGTYGVRDLIFAVAAMSLEQLVAVEAALSAALERAEAAGGA